MERPWWRRGVFVQTRRGSDDSEDVLLPGCRIAERALAARSSALQLRRRPRRANRQTRWYGPVRVVVAAARLVTPQVADLEAEAAERDVADVAH